MTTRRLYPAHVSRATRLSRYRYVDAAWARYHNCRLLRRLVAGIEVIESPEPKP